MKKGIRLAKQEIYQDHLDETIPVYSREDEIKKNDLMAKKRLELRNEVSEKQLEKIANHKHMMKYVLNNYDEK